jgi:hypothetical protein
MLHIDKKYSKAADPLDSVNINPAEREIAKAYMQSAEVFANRLFRAGAGIRSIAAAVAHGGSVLVRLARVAFGNLAHH